MILTEQEAATKACVVQGASSYAPGYISETNPVWRCVGARCMAWRWTTPIDVRAGGTIGIGYCGLAGKP